MAARLAGGMPAGMIASSPILLRALASPLAGAASGLGALAALPARDVGPCRPAVLLGFGAGVMLPASFFSLLLPGVRVAEAQGLAKPPAAAIAVGGLLLGVGVLVLLDRTTPHEHFLTSREGPPDARVLRVWRFVMAITLHNRPEALAVGVSFAGDVRQGMSVALGIGLQNMPEGLAVAAALISLGYSARWSVLVALLTGLVEPVGGLLGVVALSLADGLLPWGLTFAAGAVPYVVLDEIVPELHQGGHARAGMAGVPAGMPTTLSLDMVFG